MDGYREILARVHDESFGWIARAAAEDLIRMLRARGVTRGLVVDLGCGSGAASRMLVDGGFDVLGVDVSAAMLGLARAAVPEARFIQDSVYSVEIPPCVAVLMAGEILNYLAAPDAAGPDAAVPDIAPLLARARAALDPRGILLFDTAGPGRGGQAHREQVHEAANWTLCVRTDRDDSARRLVRRIVTFWPTDSGMFQRDLEVHTLRLLDPPQVLTALEEAGFAATRLRGYCADDLGPGWDVWACTLDSLPGAPESATRQPAPERAGDVRASSALQNRRLDPTPPAAGERFDALARWEEVLVEHIASSATPDTTWQTQDHDEWVLLLYGDATLEFDDRMVALRADDWLCLPRGTRHRVTHTSGGARWLAVHVGLGASD